MYETVVLYSVPKSCLTLWDLMDCSIPGFPVLHYLPEFTQTHAHWVGEANDFILCCPFLLLPSIFPSISVFSNELTLSIMWPKYWSFSFSNSPSSEYSGLISFRMDWLDLLAVQRTLKSLLQHHNLKALVLQHQPSLWSNSHVHTWLLLPEVQTGFRKGRRTRDQIANIHWIIEKAYEITWPTKTNPIFGGRPQRRLHAIYGACISLNKPSFSLLPLTLEFFPMWS